MEVQSIPIMNILRWVFSFLSIIFVWSLPLLSTIGFSEPSSNSISAYIANPHATGAMAFVSFTPLLIITEYQDFYIRNRINGVIMKTLLYWSLRMFLLFYGLFIIFTVNYNQTLHQIAVYSFGVSYIIHCLLTIVSINRTILSSIFVIIGAVSFIALLFIDQTPLFWAVECVGFSSMVLFTPFEITQNQSNCLLDRDELVIV